MMIKSRRDEKSPTDKPLVKSNKSYRHESLDSISRVIESVVITFVRKDN